MLTPCSVEVTWTLSSSPDVTGYLILYTTDATYIDSNDRSRTMVVDGSTATSGTLNGLEEATDYTITVRSTGESDIMSGDSNAVSITTYTDGK